MDFSADFTAIDFETASHRRDSACQLAAVVVRDGKIVDSAMWMIRPEPLYFTAANIGIHGITPDRVREESSFGDLWPEIAGKLAGDCLVAHNASFDIGVLLACLRAHHQPIPELQFTCTRLIARRTWPGRRRYGLKPLSDWLGVRFRHHDALQDSIACAKILLAAGIDRQADSLPSLEKELRIGRGSAGAWGHCGPAGGAAGRRPNPDRVVRPAIKRPPQLPSFSEQLVEDRKLVYRIDPATQSEQSTDGAKVDRLDFQRLMIRAEFIRALSGKRIVIAGRFSTLSRDEAEQLATRLGGQCQNSVNDQTDLLVVGSDDQRTIASERSVSVNEESACRRQAAGQSIQICSEEEFLGLVIAPTS